MHRSFKIHANVKFASKSRDFRCFAGTDGGQSSGNRRAARAQPERWEAII